MDSYDEDVPGDEGEPPAESTALVEQARAAAVVAQRLGLPGMAAGERLLADNYEMIQAATRWQREMTKSLAPYIEFRQQAARSVEPYLETHRQMAKSLAPYLEAQQRVVQSLEPNVETHRQLVQASGLFRDVDVMLKVLGPVQEAIAAQRAQIADAAQAYRALAEPHQLLQQQLAASLTTTLARFNAIQALSELTQVPEPFYPENWDLLAHDQARLETAMAILVDEGIPLAWVPRPEIVAALVDAPDEPARLSMLTENASLIIEDCQACLDEVESVELIALVTLLREALRGFATTPAPSQALAANVLDTFLRHANRRGQMFGAPFGYFKYEKVVKRITPVSSGTRHPELRIGCVLTPAIPAFANYDGDNDPVPTRFGRHPTAHGVDPAQYTPANVLIAVMLATSFLREADESRW